MSAVPARRAREPSALADLPAIGPDALLWVVLSPDVALRGAARPPERPAAPEPKRA